MKFSRSFSWIFSFILIISLGCSEPKNKVKPIEELTWREFTGVVFVNDEGQGIEWHDEPENHQTGEDLVIQNTEELCGGDNCGNTVSITNSNPEKAIKAIITYGYNLEGDIGYVPRSYEIPAGTTLKAGCSHFCYNEISYPLTVKVVESSYID